MARQWVITTDNPLWAFHPDTPRLEDKGLEIRYSTQIPPNRIFSYHYMWKVVDADVECEGHDVPRWEKSELLGMISGGDNMKAYHELSKEFPDLEWLTWNWLLADGGAYRHNIGQ